MRGLCTTLAAEAATEAVHGARGAIGKLPDGSASTREVKPCTVWRSEARDSQDKPVRDPGSITCSDAIERAATLDTDRLPSESAARVVRKATRRGFDQTARRVSGDSAPWIWKLADQRFPDAIQMPNSMPGTWTPWFTR